MYLHLNGIFFVNWDDRLLLKGLGNDFVSETVFHTDTITSAIHYLTTVTEFVLAPPINLA